MDSMQDCRRSLPFWKLGGLTVSSALCIWTLAGWPGALFAGLGGMIVAGALLAAVLAQCGRGATPQAPEPRNQVEFEEWTDTFDTLRDQAETVSRSLLGAIDDLDDVRLEQPAGGLEEQVSRLVDAVKAEETHRQAAIRKALIVERDAWDRTFEKTFTQRVNEVLRYVNEDRTEAISMAIAAERKAWREALAAAAAELRETFDAQRRDLLREAEELIAGGRKAGDSPASSSGTASAPTKRKSRTRKTSSRRKRARKKVGSTSS